MVEERDVVILGSGPAGYTAALYAARANLRPLVLKGLEAGGQLMLTTEVENYPGYADGIMGPELMDAMEKQAARFEAEIVAQSATRVDLSDRPFGVWAGDHEWRARTLILATGASAKWRTRSRRISVETAMTASAASRAVRSAQAATSAPRPSCSRFQGRSGSME